MFLNTESSSAAAQQQPKALLKEPQTVAVGCDAVVDSGVLFLDGSAAKLKGSL
jgi:hypothetical protein